MLVSMLIRCRRVETVNAIKKELNRLCMSRQSIYQLARYVRVAPKPNSTDHGSLRVPLAEVPVQSSGLVHEAVPYSLGYTHTLGDM
jgi:hypothetical protein